MVSLRYFLYTHLGTSTGHFNLFCNYHCAIVSSNLYKIDYTHVSPRILSTTNNQSHCCEQDFGAEVKKIHYISHSGKGALKKRSYQNLNEIKKWFDLSYLIFLSDIVAVAFNHQRNIFLLNFCGMCRNDLKSN